MIDKNINSYFGGIKLYPRLNLIWLGLIVLAGFFSLLYIWFTLFPGRVAPGAWQYFSAEQVSQARLYSQVQRLVFITSFLVQTTFLLWLVFGGRAVALSRWVQNFTGGSYWAGLLLYFVLLWMLLRLINLPFSLFSDFYWQHRWGFSTQTLGSWGVDYLKGAGLDLTLSAAGVVLLFWAFGRWPGAWWLAGAGFISLWLVIQSFLWPVVVSPLFNRFEPVRDPGVVSMVGELSRKAGLPVDKVLVMDASQRTIRANAYFAGLGSTKRIVLYDNLLEDYPPDEVKAVVAHEMAHWSRGHIVRGIALGTLGNILFWGLLFIVIRMTEPLSMRYPPYTWAVILLFFLLVSFVSSPLQNYFSRSMEKEADRVAVALTGDVQAAVRLQVNLAAKNLSDISPPGFIQWFSYTHPPALTRIEIIKEAGNGK